MSVDKGMIAVLLDRALEVFFREEAENIALGTNERNLCGRLAIYLTSLLPEFGLQDYYADIEYNRMRNGRVKTIIDHKNVVITINCDLIIHSRGERVADDNLVAFEFKKSTRSSGEKNDDRNRLRALTKSVNDDIHTADGITHPEHVCGYIIGVYIEIDVRARLYSIEEYAQGEMVSSRNGHFK